MRGSGLGHRRYHSESGASLVEFTLVFPLLVLVCLGTIDAALLMIDYSAGTAATYKGARMAVVTDPVSSAAQFTLSSYSTKPAMSGASCADTIGNASGTAICPTVNVTCTGDNTAAGGSCTSGTFNKAAFDKIFNTIQNFYVGRLLDRRQVQVTYASTNLGFVGQQSFDGTKGEVPLNVTVQLRCMTHPLYFLNGFLSWTYPGLAGGCTGITTGAGTGLTMPPFATTLPSDDLSTKL